MAKYIVINGIRIDKDYKSFVPEVYGRWTTLGPKFQLPLNGGNEHKCYQVCQCSCDQGTIAVVQVNNLKSGASYSCGCYASEQTSKARSTHRLSGTKEYWVWAALIQRCTNPNNEDYPNYGGRGIHVCDRWLAENNGFLNFMEDMGPRPGPGYTVERKLVNGNYYPENCIWDTRQAQNRNRRNNRLLTYKGKTQCLTAWAEEMGLTYGALHSRLGSGWSLEAALTTTTNGKKKNDPSN